MTDTYSEIAACAQRVLKLLGPQGDVATGLPTTGRSPAMQDVSLIDLLSPRVYEGIDASKRSQISNVLQRRLPALRGRLQHQYSKMILQHHSSATYGVSDLELEGCLIGVIETRYQSFLDQVRAVLERSLARRSSDIENRNTRGGFGDVRPPSQLKANEFSAPS